MARHNAQFRYQDKVAGEENLFDSGTRPIARHHQTPEEAPSSDRPTMPAPTLVLAELASRSVNRALVASTLPLPSSECPTVKPPAFRPMVVPVARDESSIPPMRPSLSVRRFESLDRVPFVLEPHRDLRNVSLDHREAFVLSRIDGKAAIEEVLDSTPMPTHRVLNIISGLIDRGLVALK